MGNWGKCTAARVLKVMFLQSPRAQAVTCGQRQKGRSKFHTSLGHLKSICCCCKFTPKMAKPVASGSPVSSEGRKKKDNIYVNLTLAENISFMFLASQKPPDTLALCCIRGLHGLILLSDEIITFPSSTPKADLLPICRILLNSCMRTGRHWPVTRLPPGCLRLPSGGSMRSCPPSPGHSALQREAASGFQTREKLKVRKEDKD